MLIIKYNYLSDDRMGPWNVHAIFFEVRAVDYF